MKFYNVFSFVNAFLPEVKNTGKGIWNYGKNNLFPNELIKFVLESGTAQRCVTKLKSYIAAYGFTDETLGKTVVNSYGQTANQLLTEIAEYVAQFNGFALHVSRKGGGGLDIKPIPFQCVRKRMDGNFQVNMGYGQPDYKESESKNYLAFGGAKLNPIRMREVSEDKELQDMALNGEILYAYIPSVANQQYPVPDFFAGIEDVRTSAELSKFDLETALNGFITSAILTIVGEIDDTKKDATGRTEKNYFDELLEKFTGKKKDSQGLSGRQKLMVLNAKSKDEMPMLQTFDSKSIMEASNVKKEAINRDVCRLFGIHPVLMGFSDAAVLGNQQAMANASMELNRNVDPLQEMIEAAFELLYPGKGWKISEYTPINYVDAALFPDMTEDERRNKLLGLPPIDREVPSEQEKILTTLNSLSPLIAAEVVKNMPVKDLLNLIGIKAPKDAAE